MRKIVINADDFGYSPSINRGIVEALDAGMVKSTTVLVDGVAATETLGIELRNDISVGLHFYPIDHDYELEFARQLSLFKKIYGRHPDSIDTHKQQTTDSNEIYRILKNYSEETNTPVRGFGFAQYINDFFGMDSEGVINTELVSVAAFRAALAKTKPGFNEVMCHIGRSDDYLRANSSYSDIRDAELEAILSPELNEFIESQSGIQMVNWNDVKVGLS